MVKKDKLHFDAPKKNMHALQTKALCASPIPNSELCNLENTKARKEKFA